MFNDKNALMVGIVLFHSGKELPVFLECTFKQIRLFNPDVIIYFLTDSYSLSDLIFPKYGIIVLDKDLFYSDKVQQLAALCTYPVDHFWTITTTRLVYIENFLKEYQLSDVYHFENDVLLYYTLEEHHTKFQNLYSHMAITPGGPDRNMTGLLFIRNWESLSLMTQFFVDIMGSHTLDQLKEKYGTDMVHEMSLMRMYEIEKGMEYLGYLPILPFDEQSRNYDIFNSIFDPASWGQFVGGTPDGDMKGIPGVKPVGHYIGQILLKHPEFDVIWKKDDKDRKIPYFKYGTNEVKINNLHIHSKNLSLYMS